MKWSEKAWKAIEPIYEKTVTLPFIQELTNGTLDREKFIFYIQQDAMYLSDYGSVITGIASKLKDPAHTESFIRFAGDSIVVERALHESFIHGINEKDRLKPSPACLLYTSYLWRQLANAPIEVSVAAVLPCFWIYKAVGDYILANQTNEENPYQTWINTYGGDDFSRSVSRAIEICDELVDPSLKITEADKISQTVAFLVSPMGVTMNGQKFALS
jgi:thiaminase/transcriptional activator TenA